MIRKSSVYRMLQIGLVLSQFLPGTLSTVAAAQLVFDNTFEGGFGDIRFLATPMKPAGCESKKWSLVPDPAGGAGSVFKVFQQGGSECLVAKDLKHRALVLPETSTGDRVYFLPKTEYWVGYRIYIPSDFETQYLKDTKSQIIHYQTSRYYPHGETPTINIESSDGTTVQYKFKRMYVDANGPVYAEEKLVGLTRGAWNSIIMNFRLETNSTGFLKAWVNGIQEVDFKGQTDTLDSIKPREQDDFVNIGLYWGSEIRPHDWTIYLDNWRIATGAGGFDVVNPDSGSNGLVAPPAAPIGLQLLSQ